MAAIVDKLRTHLSTPIDSEAKVVYLLCEVRKLLETEDPKPKPWALWLHCHWASHVNLEHLGTIRPLLEAMDALAADVLGDLKGAGIDDDTMLQLAYLDRFNEQLHSVLQAHSLPTALCEDDDLWYEFLRHYLNVIDEGALILTTGKHSFKHVKRVVFEKGDFRSEKGLLPFELWWHIHLQDGRIITAKIATIRAADERLSFYTQLRVTFP